MLESAAKKRTPADRLCAAARTDRPAPFEDDLSYLQEETMWVMARLLRVLSGSEIACQRVGRDYNPGGKLDIGVKAFRVLKRGHARNLKVEQKRRASTDARVVATHAAGRTMALDRVVEMFGLCPEERSEMLLAAAGNFSLNFKNVFIMVGSYGRSSELTVDVAMKFLDLNPAEAIRQRRIFAPDAPLLRNDLLTLDVEERPRTMKDLLEATISITDQAFRMIAGDQTMGDELKNFSSIGDPLASLEQVVIRDADKKRILSVVERHAEYLECRAKWGFDDVIKYGRGILMLFHGKPGTGKTMMAHALARRLGKKVLTVDAPAFSQGISGDRFLPGLFREARVQNAVVFFDECETFFTAREFGNPTMSLLLTEIERFEGVAVLSTNLPEELDDALLRRVLIKVRFPEPDGAARQEIWRKHLPEKAPLSQDVNLSALADRYALTGGLIKNAVLMAAANAFHDGGENATIKMEHLEAAARDQTKEVKETWIKPARSKTRLQDVVLPAGTERLVREFIDAAAHRATVLSKWGIGARLGYGKGVSAIFSGPPGTGKTLCAEAVAGELEKPLVRASIPSILSKWLGEMEKNIRRLFEKSASAGAVLFIDECDSLLMSRESGFVHRHDVSALNTVLDQIERFEGVAILATNLKSALDRALARRITYHIEFPLPDASSREKIWRVLIPDTAPVDETADLAALAQKFPITGGHIKNAVFKSAFRAANAGTAITQEILTQAATEELAAAEPTGPRRIGFEGAPGD